MNFFPGQATVFVDLFQFSATSGLSQAQLDEHPVAVRFIGKRLQLGSRFLE